MCFKKRKICCLTLSKENRHILFKQILNKISTDVDVVVAFVLQV